MKIKAFDTTNSLLKIFDVDILYIKYVNNYKDINVNETTINYVAICLNYDNTDVYNAFKTYYLSNANDFLHNNIQPVIRENNITINKITKNLIELDLTATLINNFSIIKIKDSCIHDNKNNIIFNNINAVKQNSLISGYQYFNEMINMKVGLISIIRDINNKISFDYINIPKEIINISTIQPYFKYIDDIYSTSEFIVNDTTIQIYDKIREFENIDFTRTDFIFRFYIKLDEHEFLLNTNDVYSNNYTVNVNSSNNIIRHGSPYTLKIQEKIDENIFKINDIIYIYDYNDNIKYIARINNININTNELTLTNIQNETNNDSTINNIEDFRLIRQLDLSNYYDIYNKTYIFNLLKNIIPIEDYIIDINDYYTLMKINNN